MHDLLPSCSFLLHCLLFVSSITPAAFVAAVESNGHFTKCRVKRQGMQVFAAEPTTTAQGTSPVNGPPESTPSTTQSLGASPSSSAEAQVVLPPFDYANQKVRGVNLGGWFMMEPWITPSMFESTGNEGIVDEYTFGQYQGHDIAQEALQVHWATWYTEQDFIDMASVGLNHARLPISYWSVPVSQDTGPYITGAWPYILAALDWANAHGIHIILDLHGAPGSQNGFDNSGQRVDGPSWALDQAHMNYTLQVIKTIAQEIGNKVAIIELLNEVAGFRGQQWSDAARNYWQAGYDSIRAVAGTDVKVMIGDAFLGLSNWNGFMKNMQGVMMDLHVYQLFSYEELQRSYDDHISFMCNRSNEFTSYAQNNLWLVMGEWSNAITDCAKYLNGRGVGARWDGTYFAGSTTLGSCQGMTGNASTFSNDYKTFMRKYWEAQVTVAEKVNGWVYWTWKAENADDWSYKAGVDNGYIPRDAAERMYPGICG